MTDLEKREGEGNKSMTKAFVIYAKNVGSSEIEALFDREWGNPNRRGPNEFQSSKRQDGPYLPVGIFLPNKDVESEWLSTEDVYFLRINKNNLYDAKDILSGKASEHVDRLWNILDHL